MLKNVLCLFAWIILLFLAGCVPPQPGGRLSPEQSGTVALLEKADDAWQNEEYSRAEELYSTLLETSGLNLKQKVLIRKRVAGSAVENGHYKPAEAYLEQWRAIQPEACKTWEWQSLFMETLLGLRQTDRLLDYARRLITRPDLALDRKLKTTLLICPLLLESKRFQELHALLQTLYQKHADRDSRRQILRSLNPFFHNQELKVLTEAAKVCPEKPPPSFPCLLLHWNAVKKRFVQEDFDRFQALQRFRTLFQASDRALQAEFNRDLKNMGLERIPSDLKLHIALLLPLTGSYAEIGWDILTGADAAQWQMLKKGIELQLSVINTAQATWEEELSSLPEDCFLIGGPLREAVWKNIHAKGLHKDRNFFTFRSSLTPGREGLDGYRFFPSRADQARALIQFLTQKMEMYRYGVLYPKSSYGRKMSQAFFQEVDASGGEITAMQGYSAAAQSDYRGLIAEFLRVPQQKLPVQADADDSAAFRPTPDFRAVFLPDGFSAARRIIPEFFFFDEYRLIFLGPTPWSQQIQNVSDLDPSYYKLVLIPGAWWSENPSPAVHRLKQGLVSSALGEPDFWSALGFDLVRFFQRLSAELSRTGGKLQKALNEFTGFSWSMAPLEWDESGKARQEMFVFQMINSTLQPADPSRMKQRILSMQEKYEHVLFNRQEP